MKDKLLFSIFLFLLPTLFPIQQFISSSGKVAKAPVSTPITDRDYNYTGYLPKFYPTASDPFCDRGYAIDVSDQVDRPDSSENYYIVPPASSLTSWSDIQMYLDDPDITYLLFLPDDYSALGTLELPEGNNCGNRRVIRPLYKQGYCTGLSNFDEIHPIELHQDSSYCTNFPKIRRIKFNTSSNWTIAFMTIGGSDASPIVPPDTPAVELWGDTLNGSNCNIIHKCVVEHARMLVGIFNSSYNTVQHTVFQNHYFKIDGDSGGLQIYAGYLDCIGNIAVGNEFINMNNAIGMPFSPGYLGENPGTVLVNNDIYWTDESLDTCSRNFDCIGEVSFECKDSETGIDIKLGTDSNNPNDRILVIGNRISGYRPTDPIEGQGAGTGGAGEAIIIHNDAANIMVYENIIYDNNIGISVWPKKNQGTTRNVGIINNLIFCSAPYQGDPNAIGSSIGIKGAAFDPSLHIYYNTVFTTGRALALNPGYTYDVKCNTFFGFDNFCLFRNSDSQQTSCCEIPQGNNPPPYSTSSFSGFNTWSTSQTEAYTTPNSYPAGITESDINLFNISIPGVNLDHLTIHTRRWSNPGYSYQLNNAIPTTMNPGPHLNFPEGYDFCDCDEQPTIDDGCWDYSVIAVDNNINGNCDDLRIECITDSAPCNGEGGGEGGSASSGVLQSTPLSLYPNPSSGEINLQFINLRASQVWLEVRNAQGQLVDRKSMGNQSPGPFYTLLQLNHLSSGVYILKITAGDQIFTEKIILE